MNFNQLRYIVAVEEHRNFARAAEACEVAQSTLSKEIQRLEKQYEVMIFDRTRHPVVPTLKGKDLIAQAQVLLQEKEAFEAIAFQKANAPSGTFHLGILSVLAPYLLPLFSREITKKYPQLDLRIRELNINQLVESLYSGNLDGAICLAPFPKEGFYETAIFQEEFLLYMREDHPLARLSDLQWQDLPEEEIILQEDFKPFFCEKNGNKSSTCPLGHQLQFSGNSLETIRKIIDRSGGITLIPNLACQYMGERRLRMVHPIPDSAFQKSVTFVTPRGFEKTRISKAILKEIKQNLPLQPHSRPSA